MLIDLENGGQLCIVSFSKFQNLHISIFRCFITVAHCECLTNSLVAVVDLVATCRTRVSGMQCF